MMTRPIESEAPTARRGVDTSRSNRLISEPTADTANPREEP